MTRIHVSASKEYDVLIERGLFSQIGALCRNVVRGKKCVVVSDSHVAPLYMDAAIASLREAGFDASGYTFPAGEASKCGETYLDLLETLAQRQITRSDLLVALGGGVVGDLTGFAAATFLRGVALVQVPTTLLACVDSSVGGKTAIDLKHGKNLCGAFYQPNLVICDPDMLNTLPDAVFSEGCAEVIKYGMLGSAELLEKLKEAPVADQAEYVIAKCVEMKRDIVEGDEFDTGRRQLLNLGHTFAHSIEALSSYALSHGQAVAIGMVIITRAAVRRGICPPECLDVLLELLAKNNLPNSTQYSPEALAEKALSDKKRAADTVTLAVPTAYGASELLPQPVSALIEWASEGLKA